MERTQSTVPYSLRWRQVNHQLRNLKQRLKRDETVYDGIHTIGLMLRKEAIAHGQSTILQRVDFLNAITKIMYFEHIPITQLSLFFSVFDPMKKNFVRFADILTCFAILDRPSDTAIEKAATVWMLNEEYGNDMAPLEMVT